MYSAKPKLLLRSNYRWYTWLSWLGLMVCACLLMAACEPVGPIGGTASPGATVSPTSSIGTSTPVSTPMPTPIPTAASTPVPVNQPTIAATQVSVPAPVLTSIRMVDTSNGWALTKSAVLKTSDGGRHWQNVQPRGQSLGMNPHGEFLTTLQAWVAWQAAPEYAAQQTITIIHTSDGGLSWHTATINNAVGGLVDAPRFINLQQGWLVTSQAQGMLHYTVTTYRTTNGGQSWLRMGQMRSTSVAGVSFLNAQLGWAGIEWPGNTVNVQKTTNSGQSWQQVQLPAPNGVSNPQNSIGNTLTTPPVLFGATGLLPAHISVGSQPTAHLTIYTTHDSGAHWISGALADFDSHDVYVADSQHIWAEESNSPVLHFSANGGKTWVRLTTTPQQFGELSFVSPQYGWAISSIGHLYHTVDGGHSWQALS
jgi:Uncharacterized protein related to plant photosystem II stability/assembly factor